MMVQPVPHISLNIRNFLKDLSLVVNIFDTVQRICQQDKVLLATSILRSSSPNIHVSSFNQIHIGNTRKSCMKVCASPTISLLKPFDQ